MNAYWHITEPNMQIFDALEFWKLSWLWSSYSYGFHLFYAPKTRSSHHWIHFRSWTFSWTLICTQWKVYFQTSLWTLIRAFTSNFQFNRSQFEVLNRISPKHIKILILPFRFQLRVELSEMKVQLKADKWKKCLTMSVIIQNNEPKWIHCSKCKGRVSMKNHWYNSIPRFVMR